MKDTSTSGGLWGSVSRGSDTFGPKSLKDMPEGVRLYFQHSILPGTVLARGVRLRMHGEIDLSGWLPFRAEQVILGRGEMVWAATVRRMGIPVKGYDRLLDGKGELDWKVLGVIPVMRASGSDVTRSAAGRVKAEMLWLPSAFLQSGARISQEDPGHITIDLSLHGDDSPVTIEIDSEGRPVSLRMKRWGNPLGEGYGLHDFGAFMEDEKTFGGYTIPSKLRVGWFFGTDRFEREGQFFRVTIDEATFR
ncbi:MAG: hypothetical protein JXA64_07030 [Candidatus Fermentibacteraceae bacterium]|nr:hypothetical protein [Candidatus Fermentibacteraceae bacterium]